jgi:DNA mismatch repair ATPase MutS
MSRPKFLEYTDENKSVLDIKGMIHPCLKLTSGKSFIPNDTYISAGGKNGSE